MQTETQTNSELPAPRKRKLPGGFKLLTVILSVIVIGLVLVIVLVWKPWQQNIKASDRVVTVTGEATLTATPDEYTFTPTYDFTSSDQQTALSQLTAMSNQLVSKLKSLGVPSKDIQTSSNGYNSGNNLPVLPVPVSQDNGQYTYELDPTITIDGNTNLAQKVQNYLVTTNPTGDVSPSVDFSAAMQTSLANKARGQAEQNARANAEQSAKNLGFKIAAVKTVVDNGLNNNNYVTPCSATPGSSGAASSSICAGSNLSVSSGSGQSLNLQPGQNQLYYSVQVQYYID
ncbi:MAG TPA: SIMPL domain-containing protein [Patescibacteria group bacterium]|jgi:uncharacterized protein YggE|nr:SIMPL domain-containing protein [Patescibacteria group bacterium]